MQRPARVFAISNNDNGSGQVFSLGSQSFFWFAWGASSWFSSGKLQICGTKSLATSCDAAVHGRPTNLLHKWLRNSPLGVRRNFPEIVHVHPLTYHFSGWLTNKQKQIKGTKRNHAQIKGTKRKHAWKKNVIGLLQPNKSTSYLPFITQPYSSWN